LPKSERPEAGGFPTTEGKDERQLNMAVSRFRFIVIVRSVISKGVVLALGILGSLVVLEVSLGVGSVVRSYLAKGEVVSEGELRPYEPWGLNRGNTYDPICYFIPKDGFFRGPIKRHWIDRPVKKEADTIRVMCIGDSTTYGVAVDYDHSWVYLLGTLLSKQYPEKKIEVLNAGQIGAIPKQIKRFFQFHLAEYQPDILVWRVNSELSDTYLVDTRPHPVRAFVCRHLYESRVFRLLCALADLWDIEGGSRKVARGIYDFMTGRELRCLELSVDGFDSDFSMVEKIAREHGTKYVLQVEYLTRSRDGKLFSFTKTGGRGPVVKMMNAFRENDTRTPSPENGKQVNRSTKPRDPLFVDDCHLSEKGEAITAEEVYKFIVENKWIETLP